MALTHPGRAAIAGVPDGERLISDVKTDRLGAWLVSEARGQLRIAHQAGDGLPQIAALHLRDSYLRLNYGPGAGWGTSVILLPVYWCDGCCHHGARVRASWHTRGPNLVLGLGGRIGDLDVTLDVTLSPPDEEGVLARLAGRVDGSVRLDVRPGEAFKPVMLSSMRISPHEWDACQAQAGERLLPIPAAGWIGPQPPVRADSLALLGGTCRWKENATTIRIALDEPLEVAGWVTPSRDPNDDNVGLWAAADRVLSTWSYTISATHPDAEGDSSGGQPGAATRQHATADVSAVLRAAIRR